MLPAAHGQTRLVPTLPALLNLDLQLIAALLGRSLTDVELQNILALSADERQIILTLLGQDLTVAQRGEILDLLELDLTLLELQTLQALPLDQLRTILDLQGLGLITDLELQDILALSIEERQIFLTLLGQDLTVAQLQDILDLLDLDLTLIELQALQALPLDLLRTILDLLGLGLTDLQLEDLLALPVNQLQILLSLLGLDNLTAGQQQGLLDLLRLTQTTVERQILLDMLSSNQSLITPTIASTSFKPDGSVSKGALFRGDNIYNTSGRRQTVSKSVTTGIHARTFTVMAQNDGTVADRFRLTGPGRKPGFTVKYFDQATNISALVKGPGFVTPLLAPGATYAITVTIKTTAAAVSGSRFKAKVMTTASQNPASMDAVRARVIVQ